mmetsp:Transcript_53889/g.129856  ORF Transcript_53889/g.129856 Transcript_53889/m.129856 type:complete len:302 (+) Transcript_53889:1625-2530(+)
MASETKASARGPCPCPSETPLSRLPYPILSASLLSSVIGSAPGDSTKISGDTIEESSKQPWRLKAGGEMNASPTDSATNCCVTGITLSGRMQRSTQILRNVVHSLPVNISLMISIGSGASKTPFHASRFLANRSSNISNGPPSSATSMMLPQIVSVSHEWPSFEAAGFFFARSSAELPCSANRSSAVGSKSSPSWIFVASRNENSNLSFSNRERHTFSYSTYVNVSFRPFRRVSVSPVGDFLMANLNRFTYHSREYWYIGSMLARSAIAKNSRATRLATTLYMLRVSWILACVRSAIFTCS